VIILGGSGIVTNNIANIGGKYFNYGLLPLHSPQNMQDARTEILGALLTLILGGSGIVTNNIANKGGEYFHSGFLLLHSP